MPSDTRYPRRVLMFGVGEQAGLMLAQEAAEDLEDVAEAAYVPSAGGYAQVHSLHAHSLSYMPITHTLSLPLNFLDFAG
jgi:hypothetical protein